MDPQLAIIDPHEDDVVDLQINKFQALDDQRVDKIDGNGVFVLLLFSLSKL